MLLNDLPKGVIQDICSLNNIIVGNKRIVPIEQKNQHVEELRGRICSIILSLLLEKYRKNSALLSKELSRDQIHDMNRLIEIEEGDKIPLLLEDRFNYARTLKAKIGSAVLSLLLEEYQKNLESQTRMPGTRNNRNDFSYV